MSKWIKKPKGKYRSKFEQTIAKDLVEREVKAKYEFVKIEYLHPSTNRWYKPDWILKNGIIIEAKGRFTTEDRKKHCLVKQQYPELDIRFVFQNPNVKISSGSKTTYGDWATKNGFKWSKLFVPDSWVLEKPRKVNLFKVDTETNPYKGKHETSV